MRCFKLTLNNLNWVIKDKYLEYLKVNYKNDYLESCYRKRRGRPLLGNGQTK